jgi:hypothetical protein
MAVMMDFPANPTVGQNYTNTYGTVYVWDGVAWLEGSAAPIVIQVPVVGDILSQIRTLLQDTDNSSGDYRYSDDSILADINMGLLEMFRVRPDIFLALGFNVPRISSIDPNQPWPLEPQWSPSIIYYAVGLAQARDDEQSQDARAAALLQIYQKSLLTVS